MTTVTLYESWQDILIKGLNQEFERRYMHGSEEYILFLDNVLSYIPTSIKNKFREEGKKYENIDFRVPFIYEKYRERLIKTFENLDIIYDGIKNIDQKQAQDLRNLLVYTNSTPSKILPREANETIYLTNFIQSFINAKKLTYDYWKYKPLTDLTIVFSQKYTSILQDIENKTSSLSYIDEKGRLYITISPFDLYKSLDEVGEVKIELKDIVKNSAYRIACGVKKLVGHVVGLYDKLEELYEWNTFYRWITNMIASSSLVAGFIPCVTAAFLAGDFKRENINLGKSAILITFLYLTNTFTGIISLDITGFSAYKEKYQLKKEIVYVDYRYVPSFEDIFIKMPFIGAIPYTLYYNQKKRSNINYLELRIERENVANIYIEKDLPFRMSKKEIKERKKIMSEVLKEIIYNSEVEIVVSGEILKQSIKIEKNNYISEEIIEKVIDNLIENNKTTKITMKSKEYFSKHKKDAELLRKLLKGKLQNQKVMDNEKVGI